MSNFDHFVGTRPVSDQHAFDIQALSAWLGQNMEGFAGPSQRRCSRGAVQPHLQADHTRASYVMRSKPGPGRQAAAVGARDRA